MARLALFLLGPPRLERDGVPLHFDTRKILALAAYVVMTGPAGRDTLMALLWPELEPSRAQSVLRRNLSLLKTALAGEWLRIDRQQVAADPGADLWLDVAEFRRLHEAAAGHGHAAGEACPTCLAWLEEAVALYRGDFLEGFTLRDSAAFDDWQFFQAESLRRELSSALERLVSGHVARAAAGEAGQDGYQAALAYARRRLALDPLHEPAHRQLMTLYNQVGQRSAALRQYRECARILEEEMGLAPDAETTALREQIRAGLPASGVVPWSIPARAAPAAHNLPAQATPLLGRERELAEVRARLQDPGCRLLTLLGPGGVGKTRLALQAAEEMDRTPSFRHGAFLCPLASVPCCQGVVPAVAEAIGYHFRTETEDRPQATHRRQLLDYLRRKHLLLVLDNFEHLLVEGASPDDSLGLIADLLAAAPAVKLLVTSRASLQVQGEYLYPVRGLQVPPRPMGRLGSRPVTQVNEPDQAARLYGAVALFRQGARQVRPAFELRAEDYAPVAQICRLVEGLPLGILLAAAWVEVLSPAEIAAEIERSLDFLETDRRDAPLRQRSMRAVFDYSWQLLDERERDILLGLAVFRGGFSLEAAQAVAGATPRDVRSLVNKSFVQPATAGRFDLHELLRQYAMGRLEAAPLERRAALHSRHCDYYCAALERWSAEIKGPRQGEAMDKMDLEMENARAAWHWAIDRGPVDRLAQAMDGLALYHTWRARYDEGEAALRAAVAGLESRAGAEPGARQLWARALTLRGDFLIDQGQKEPGIAAVRRALALLEEMEAAGQDVRAEQAQALFSLGRILRYFYPDPHEAEAVYRRSAALFEQVGDRWSTARSLDSLGILIEDLGRFGEARELCEQSLAICCDLGDGRGMAEAMHDLGVIAWVQGHLDDAMPLLEESAGLFRRLDDWSGLAWALKSLGELLVRRGLFDDGLVVLESCIQICDELGDAFGVGVQATFASEARLHLGQYCETLAEVRREQAADAWSSHRWTRAFARFVHGLALLALLPGGEPGAAAGEALAVIREAAAGFDEIRHRENRGWVAGPLGLAAYLAGDPELARREVAEALRTGLDLGVFMPLGYGLPAAARLLAGHGEVERAVEVYACAAGARFVAGSRWFHDVVGAPLEAAAAGLPEEVVAAARRRGRAQSWQEMARRALAKW